MNRFQALMSRMLRIKPRVVRVAASSGTNSRMYSSAKSSRLTGGWVASNTSADAELDSSLTQLRTRSRSLNRDSPYAKRARAIAVNNIIGCGIRLQAQVKTTRGDFNKAVNAEIEEMFEEWSYAQNCHIGGRLCFADMERFNIGQVFDAGEVLIRRHFTAMSGSPVPYTLEPIEAERIADNIGVPGVGIEPGNQFRMGIELDRYYKPVAYFIRERHPAERIWPGETNNRVERVPADQIIHLARITRWPQTRGEPWMHAVAETLNDMNGYSEAEIVRARSQACIIGAIETPEDAVSLGEEQADGSVEMELSEGTLKRLNPGEKLTTGPMNAPNPVYADFMREKKREVAVGIGVNYASLSGDYSQADYSPLKLSLNDDRDSWKDHQQWYIRAVREIVHREWLQQAVFAGALKTIPVQAYALDRKRYEAAQFRTRGWSYVDPTKENEADKNAVRSGFKTLSSVLINSGSDLEEYIEERTRETDLLDEAGLVLDTNPEQVAKTGVEQPSQAPPPQAAPQAPEQTPPARGFSHLQVAK